MSYRIETDRLREAINKATFLEDGDLFERAKWGFLREAFPNLEACWKVFVVPFTKRIEDSVENDNQRIDHREGVAEEIKSLGITQYSVFLNLIYAHDHLDSTSWCKFEDFYMHLVAVCDLSEEFLTNWYLLVLQCQGAECQVLQRLTRDEFLLLAGEWYDKRYSTLYGYYKERGKIPAIDFPPSRKNILDEYFQSAPAWHEYKVFSNRLREYRNALVHRQHIMRVHTSVDGVMTLLVPRKENVQKYKTWSSVQAAVQVQNRASLQNDFMPMEQLMRSDIEQLKTLLNKLWLKPVEEMVKLLLDDKNNVLLRKYDLTLD